MVYNNKVRDFVDKIYRYKSLIGRVDYQISFRENLPETESKFKITIIEVHP